MVHVASVSVNAGWQDTTIVGKGSTWEEATENCLAQIRKHLDHGVELGESVVLPHEKLDEVPTNLPDGCGLLILVRCGHSNGEAYDWRYFAVMRGNRVLGLPFSEGSWEFTAGASPVKHSFVDCNADYEFLLPEGSKEFVGGDWVPCEVAQYDY